MPRNPLVRGAVPALLLMLLARVHAAMAPYPLDPEPLAAQGDDDPEALFARFDDDRDGTLDRAEFERMFRDTQWSAEAEAVVAGEETPVTDSGDAWIAFFDGADVSRDGKLTVSEWSRALLAALRRRRQGDTACPAADAVAAAAEHSAGGAGEEGDEDPADFAMAFDKNRDGVLDLEEFREVMSTEGMDTEEEDDEEIDEVAEVFAKWDVTMDARLSPEELRHGLNLAAGIVPEIPAEFYKKETPDEFGRVVPPDVMAALQEGHDMVAGGGADPGELFALVRAGDAMATRAWLDENNNMVDGSASDGTCSPLHVALQMFDKAVQHLHYDRAAGNHTAVQHLPSCYTHTHTHTHTHRWRSCSLNVGQI